MRLLIPALVLCASTSSAQIVFAPPVPSPVAADPGGLLAGDLDGDGDQDLVVSRPSTSGVPGSVALNAGDGTFREVQTLAGSAIVTSDLDDLDGDGVLDLVMAQFGFDVHPVLRFGLGDGTFGPEIVLPYVGSLLTIRTGDVDGDGDRDLVIGSRSVESLSIQGEVSALLNDGTGAFPIEVVVSSLEADRLEVGDMNGDGLDDVVFATTPATTSLVVALSLGSGAFALGPACATCSGLAGFPNDLALADVDLDGDLDVFLLLVPLIGGPVSLFTNDGAAALSAPTQTGLVFAQAFEVADLDGDGLPDLLGKDIASASAALSHHELRVHRNLGGGTFGELLETTICDLPFDLVTADFDGDGREDAAVVDPSIDAIVVTKNATYFASQPFVDLGKNDFVGREKALEEKQGGGTLRRVSFVVEAFSQLSGKIVLRHHDRQFALETFIECFRHLHGSNHHPVLHSRGSRKEVRTVRVFPLTASFWCG